MSYISDAKLPWSFVLFQLFQVSYWFSKGIAFFLGFLKIISNLLLFYICNIQQLHSFIQLVGSPSPALSLALGIGSWPPYWRPKKLSPANSVEHHQLHQHMLAAHEWCHLCSASLNAVSNSYCSTSIYLPYGLILDFKEHQMDRLMSNLQGVITGLMAAMMEQMGAFASFLDQKAWSWGTEWPHVIPKTHSTLQWEVLEVRGPLFQTCWHHTCSRSMGHPSIQSQGTVERGVHWEAGIVHTEPKNATNGPWQPWSKLRNKVPTSLADGWWPFTTSKDIKSSCAACSKWLP